ncbi:unnamed protein product, partial [Owenia fusiformis]
SESIGNFYTTFNSAGSFPPLRPKDPFPPRPQSFIPRHKKYIDSAYIERNPNPKSTGSTSYAKIVAGVAVALVLAIGGALVGMYFAGIFTGNQTGALYLNATSNKPTTIPPMKTQINTTITPATTTFPAKATTAETIADATDRGTTKVIDTVTTDKTTVTDTTIPGTTFADATTTGTTTVADTT